MSSYRIDSLNGEMRDELWNRKGFITRGDVRVLIELIEQERREYNQIRPIVPSDTGIQNQKL